MNTEHLQDGSVIADSEQGPLAEWRRLRAAYASMTRAERIQDYICACYDLCTITGQPDIPVSEVRAQVNALYFKGGTNAS